MVGTERRRFYTEDTEDTESAEKKESKGAKVQELTVQKFKGEWERALI